MLRISAWTGKLSALGASGALHAALILTTPLGHPAAGTASRESVTLDVEVESEPAPLPVEPLENHENHAPAYHTHTHPYPVPASHDWIPHDPSLIHVMQHPHEEPPPPPVADTSHVVTAASEMPRFSMVVSSGPTGAGGLATTDHDDDVGGPAGHDHEDGLIVSEQAVDEPARMVRGVTPVYPGDARASGIEAKVRLELIVSASGAVEDVKVTGRAGHGLDEAAAVAARRFTFSPAIRQGRPVRVRMSWVVDFRLD